MRATKQASGVILIKNPLLRLEWLAFWISLKAIWSCSNSYFYVSLFVGAYYSGFSRYYSWEIPERQVNPISNGILFTHAIYCFAIDKSKRFTWVYKGLTAL